MASVNHGIIKKRGYKVDKEIIDRIRNIREGFPNLLGMVKDGEQKYLFKNIPTIADYLEAGTIPNAELSSARRNLEQVVKIGFDNLISKPYFNFYDGKAPESILEVSYQLNVDLHLVASAQNKFEKLKKQYPDLVEHPIAESLKTFFNEALVLSGVGQYLKENAVKRVAKSVSEKETEARYVPPMADKAAERLVRGALTKLTDESYVRLKDGLMSFYKGSFERALEKSALDPSIKANLQPFEKMLLIKHARRTTRSDPYTPYPNMVCVLNDISANCVQEANDIRESFVIKNLRKLASIIDKKGGLESIEERGRTVSISGLKGSFLFKFSDGSSFEAHNEVVVAMSSKGNRFQRYPLTFHNIVPASPEATSELKPGQDKLAMRSEEWMNKMF